MPIFLANRSRGRFAWTTHTYFQITKPGSIVPLHLCTIAVPIEAANSDNWGLDNKVHTAYGYTYIVTFK